MIYFDIPANEAAVEVTINDERLTSVVGESYKWHEAFAEIIEMLISTEEEIRVQDAADLQRMIQREYIDAGYLNLNAAPLFIWRPVSVVMTGSRAGDAKAAEEKLVKMLRRRVDHDGYTWHHSENIRPAGGRWICDMYLVESGYHRRHPHKGGVYVYVHSTGRAYA